MTSTEQSSPPHSSTSNGRAAVLVTAPRCTRESSNGAIEVESEKYDTVELASSPAIQKRVTSSRSDHDCVLQELTDRAMLTHIMAPSGEHEVSEGFDACREYGYRYEYTEDGDDDNEEESVRDDDDDEGEHIETSAPIHCFIGVPALADNLEDDSPPPFLSYILGKTYHPVTDYAPRRDDESSLFWFTYRCDFPQIAPYGLTTDAGWGCMLRSAQMMLAQALRMHYHSRDWRPPQSVAKRRLDPFVRRVLTWMADFPSKSENVYSLHNMVAAGIARYEVLPGEWWGPGLVSHVLCDLCALYEEQHEQVLKRHDATFRRTFAPGDIHRPMFRVHVASQGTVYRDSIEKLMTTSGDNHCKVADADQTDPLSHPLDTKYSSEETRTTQPLEWDTSLLLLIPLRLGLKAFNEEYSMALAHIFSWNQSVGVLGGRPRGARWFYGASSDGRQIFGLDPHTIQTAPHRQMVTTNVGTRVRVIAFTEEYLRSVHTKYPEEVPMSRMDPSMTIGFYCRDREDFEELCSSLERWKGQHETMPSLFAVEDSVPDYTANVSSAMNEMMFEDDEFADAFADEAGQDNASDEDEYVML